MGSNVLEWKTSECLPCVEDEIADVYIQITPEVIAPQVCSTIGGDSRTANIIAGQVVSKMICKNLATGKCEYKYILVYDNVQLISNYTLQESDIVGVFCRNSLTQFVLDKVGQPVQIRTDNDGRLILINQYGCEYQIDLDSDEECDMNSFPVEIWTPTISVEAPLTMSDARVGHALFQVQGKRVSVSMSIEVDITANERAAIEFTLPIAAADVPLIDNTVSFPGTQIALGLLVDPSIVGDLCFVSVAPNSVMGLIYPKGTDKYEIGTNRVHFQTFYIGV